VNTEGVSITGIAWVAWHLSQGKRIAPATMPIAAMRRESLQ
jgi:hypothetical protein